MGVIEASKDTLYLGMLLSLGRKKCYLYNFLLQRIKKRIECWRERNLCNARKLIMAKTII